MAQLMMAFWADDAGFILSTELVLVATIVVLGLLAALVAVRDAVGGELMEVAAAVRSLDQSYYYSGMGARKNYWRGFKSWTAGSAYGAQVRGPVVIERPAVEAEFACPPAQEIVQPQLAPCVTGDCVPPAAPLPAPAPCGPGNPCGEVVPTPCEGCGPPTVPQPLVW